MNACEDTSSFHYTDAAPRGCADGRRSQGSELTCRIAGSQELATAITTTGAVLLAAYVEHQASISTQSTKRLVTSLREYLSEVESDSGSGTGFYGIGDQWSALIFWRDETSWVGVPGVLAYQAVRELVCVTLRRYFSMLDSGMSQRDIATSIAAQDTASPRVLRLMSELGRKASPPNFREVVFHAVRHSREYCECAPKLS